MRKGMIRTVCRLVALALLLESVAAIPVPGTNGKYVWQEEIKITLEIRYQEQSIASLLLGSAPLPDWQLLLSNIRAARQPEGLVLSAEEGYLLPDSLTVSIGDASYIVHTNGLENPEGICFAPETGLLSVSADMLAAHPGTLSVAATAVLDTAGTATDITDSADTVTGTTGTTDTADTVTDATDTTDTADTVTDATDTTDTADTVPDATDTTDTADTATDTTDTTNTADTVPDTPDTADTVTDATGTTDTADSVTDATGTTDTADTVTDATGTMDTADTTDTVTGTTGTTDTADTVPDATGTTDTADTVTGTTASDAAANVPSEETPPAYSRPAGPAFTWDWDLTHIRAKEKDDALILSADEGYRLPVILTVRVGSTTYEVYTDGSKNPEEFIFDPAKNSLSLSEQMIASKLGTVKVIAVGEPVSQADSGQTTPSGEAEKPTVPAGTQVPQHTEAPTATNSPTPDPAVAATDTPAPEVPAQPDPTVAATDTPAPEAPAQPDPTVVATDTPAPEAPPQSDPTVAATDTPAPEAPPQSETQTASEAPAAPDVSN